jgi:hypothetical protein
MSVATAPTFDALELPLHPPLPGLSRPATTVVVLSGDPSSDICLSTLVQLGDVAGPLDQVLLVAPAAQAADVARELPWVTVVDAHPDSTKVWLKPVLDSVHTSSVVVVRAAVCAVGPWIDEVVGALGDSGSIVVAPMTNLGNSEMLLDIGLRAIERAAGLRARALHLQAVTARSTVAVADLGAFCAAAHVDVWRNAAALSLESLDDVWSSLIRVAQPCVVQSAYLCQLGDAQWNPDGLDWDRVSEQSTAAIRRWLQRWLSPAVVGVSHPSAEVREVLAAEGWTIEELDPSTSLVDQIDAIEQRGATRPTLVVVGDNGAPQLALLDVATIHVGTVDHEVAVDRQVADAAGVRLALADLDENASFGTAMVACRAALDDSDLRRAIESVDLARTWRPEAPQVLNALAVCAVVMGRIDEAQNLVIRALQQAPDFNAAIDNAVALGLIEPTTNDEGTQL